MDRLTHASVPTNAELVTPHRESTLAIIDVSNVAFGGSSGRRTPRLKVIETVLEELAVHGFEVVAIADASLRHRIDDRNGFEQLIATGRVLQAPAGCDADRFLAALAEKRAAEGQRVVVLTDDLLREFPAIAKMRLPFLLIGELEVLYYLPLGDFVASPTPRDSNPAAVNEVVPAG